MSVVTGKEINYLCLIFMDKEHFNGGITLLIKVVFGSGPTYCLVSGFCSSKVASWVVTAPLLVFLEDCRP